MQLFPTRISFSVPGTKLRENAQKRAFGRVCGFQHDRMNRTFSTHVRTHSFQGRQTRVGGCLHTDAEFPIRYQQLRPHYRKWE